MRFILLCGLNKSGKSTTAEKIKKQLVNEGYRVCIKSFATPLKQLASMYFDYDESTKYEQRVILETLATNLKTAFGKTLFGYTLLDEFKYVDVDYVIVDDLRFKEEHKIISEFYETYVVKMPDTEYIEKYDDERLSSLLWYFDCNDVPCLKMRDLKDYTLEQVLDKLK